MPPRKRAASKPEATEDQQTPEAPEMEEQPAGGETPPATSGSADTNDESDDGDTPTESPAKSDLQEADQPCTECMPNGWPEGAFSVGCTHGTWIRKKQ